MLHREWTNIIQHVKGWSSTAQQHTAWQAGGPNQAQGLHSGLRADTTCMRAKAAQLPHGALMAVAAAGQGCH
jgi:hypothetical protein